MDAYPQNQNSAGNRTGRSSFIPDCPFFIGFNFVPVFFCDHQHSKAFTLIFFQMLMMHFMRPPDTSHIYIIAACEKFYSLVDYNIMYQEICKAVHCYTCAYCSQPKFMIKCSEKMHRILGMENIRKKASFFSKTPGPFL